MKEIVKNNNQDPNKIQNQNLVKDSHEKEANNKGTHVAHEKEVHDKMAPHLDLFENRLKKLNELREINYDPYSLYFKPENFTNELLEIDPTKYNQEKIFSIAGRMRSCRVMGKAAFCDLEDEKGRIQLYVSKDELKDQFFVFQKMDLGDIFGVKGFLFLTKTGQKTLHVEELVLLAKCLQTLPTVKEADGKIFDAFNDQELRYRKRYLDLILNPNVREVFFLRSQIISQIRKILEEQGFLEVETPSMQTIPGGASARPFVTHHNTLNLDLYLRVAPELFLKRLIVGGFNKVFEIGRNYRNEGISTKHNPEFTMLELYEAYGNMDTMILLFEKIISTIVKKVKGSTEIVYGEHKISFKTPFKKISYLDSIEQYTNLKFDSNWSLEEAKNESKKINILKSSINVNEIDKANSIWEIAELLFDKFVEPELIQPTLIIDYPKEISPLAKSWKDRPNFVERFEPFIAGREIGNAFSELNDPIDQKMRFESQKVDRIKANEAGAMIDYDYIEALEYGMPPCGGMGIGIDRLVMLLTNTHTIKDTILFPLLKPI